MISLSGDDVELPLRGARLAGVQLRLRANNDNKHNNN